MKKVRQKNKINMFYKIKNFKVQIIMKRSNKLIENYTLEKL